MISALAGLGRHVEGYGDTLLSVALIGTAIILLVVAIAAPTWFKALVLAWTIFPWGRITDSRTQKTPVGQGTKAQLSTVQIYRLRWLGWRSEQKHITVPLPSLDFTKSGITNTINA